MKSNLSPAPQSVRAEQALFVLNGAIWLVFGIISLLRMAGAPGATPTMLLAVAILMLGNAGAMVLAGVGLGTRWRRRPAYYWGLVVLAANIILTFTDQFGTIDLVTLSVDLALLGLLVATWKSYHAKGQGAGQA